MKMMTLTDTQRGQLVEVWDGRASMRTLADALTKLHDLGGLTHDGYAEIRTMPILLPNGERSAIVAVLGTLDTGRWQIAMPTSAHFTAAGTLGERQRFEISRLTGAVADADGNVQLHDGSYVHNVELEPTHLTYDLTITQQKILHHAICFLRAEHRCYRYLDDRLSAGGMEFYAVSELGRGTLPSLKAMERHILRQMPDVSRQTIATALANSGLRRPRSGRRAA